MALQEELELQGNYLFKYRGTLPLIILFSGILTFIYSKINLNGFEKYVSYKDYELLCLLVSFIGFAIRVYTVGYTPKNTSGRNTESQLADELNKSGSYSIVRHPLYAGNFFMWLGVGLLTQNIWYIISFVFIYWVYYERIMFAEEQFLRKKFGESYLEWAAVTPAFIFSFKNYTPPKISFSWKKVVKQEKNGFTAIFVVFFLFRSINDFIETETIVVNSRLAYITAGSIVLYFILKYVKKYTTILNEKER